MNDRYLARIARSVGVPPWEIEDAVQEIKIALWKSKTPYWKAVVKYTAIDYVRWLNNPKRKTVQLVYATTPGPEHEVEAKISLARVMDVIRTLPQRQRQAMFHVIHGYPMDVALSSSASKARLKLRAAC